MRLMRVGAIGQETPILSIRGRHLDLSPITSDIDGDFLASGGLQRVPASGYGLPEVDIGGQRIGAPIARPGAIVCVGLNYAAHAAESGTGPPVTPVVFYKAPNTLVGPYDNALIPRGATKTDWEVELGVVIGRRVRYLASPDQALSYVAGYVLSNDISERDFQLNHSGGQWSKGKSCETFQPLGPWLATRDEIPDPQNLRLRSWVNGAARQDSSTRDMIFTVAYIIWHLSQYTVLEPGDLINTGTPAGVALSGRFPYLTAGDVVEVDIDGLGRQRTVMAQA